MEYRFHKDNPFLRQHVLHVGRHELIRQDATDDGHSIWKNRVVISINDTKAERDQMHNILEGASKDNLYIICQDDESMTDEQAQQIRHFVWKHHHENFLVHCYLGVSRSAAVAKWIAERLNLSDPELEQYIGYNDHIYNLLKQNEESWHISG